MCSLLNFRFGIHRDKSASEGIVTFYLKTSYVQGIFCVKLVSLNLKCSKIRLQSALLYKFLICSIAPSFYSGADGLILVYDITRYEFHDITVVLALKSLNGVFCFIQQPRKSAQCSPLDGRCSQANLASVMVEIVVFITDINGLSTLYLAEENMIIVFITQKII